MIILDDEPINDDDDKTWSPNDNYDVEDDEDYGAGNNESTLVIADATPNLAHLEPDNAIMIPPNSTH
jgi:hypothetical protein